MSQIEDVRLRIEKTIAAPIDRVRAALTDPALLARWFAPGPMAATVHSCDATVGGQWEIAMQGPGPSGGDETHTCTGVFKELSPTRVATTFNWTEQPLPNETTVIYELEADGERTHLVMIHEGLPDREAVTQHTSGWEGCLAKLPGACA